MTLWFILLVLIVVGGYFFYRKAITNRFHPPPMEERYRDYSGGYEPLLELYDKLVKQPRTTHNATLTASSWWSQQRVRKAA